MEKTAANTHGEKMIRRLFALTLFIQVQIKYLNAYVKVLLGWSDNAAVTQEVVRQTGSSKCVEYADLLQ